ncbi:MAG: glycosyltransferase family 4 protein [Sulfolobales archaeon]
MITITQTPLVRFKIGIEEIVKRLGSVQGQVDLSLLREGEDYILSPGGVTRMVYPFLRRLVDMGGSPWWVSLNPNAPQTVVANGIKIYHVSVPTERIKGYGKAKEVIWGTLHMIHESVSQAQDLMWMDEYIDYIYYNRRVAQAVDMLDREEDFDIIYIHDFQHIPLGTMLTTIKPRIFRWHIPLEKSLIPDTWIPSLDLYLNKYNTIIVSSKRYSKNLVEMGYRGRVVEMYPYIDPTQYKIPSRDEVEKFASRYGIAPDDKLILVVARMDPMKGQDRAIKALKLVKKEIPEAKLMLVGNGSFSSSKNGIGLSKGERWAGYLSSLANELGLANDVIMTGYLGQRDLEAAYSRADVVLLPSIIEGFGLVVVEGWLYRKPAIVSSNAGVADLVRDGENGFIVDPNSFEDIAEKIKIVLKDERLAEELGRRGYETSKRCYIDTVFKEEMEVIERTIEGR